MPYFLWSPASDKTLTSSNMYNQSTSDKAWAMILIQSSSVEASSSCIHFNGLLPKVKHSGNRRMIWSVRFWSIDMKLGLGSQKLGYRKSQIVGTLDAQRSLARSIVNLLEVWVDLLARHKRVDCLPVAHSVRRPDGWRKGLGRRRYLPAQFECNRTAYIPWVTLRIGC